MQKQEIVSITNTKLEKIFNDTTSQPCTIYKSIGQKYLNKKEQLSI